MNRHCPKCNSPVRATAGGLLTCAKCGTTIRASGRSSGSARQPIAGKSAGSSKRRRRSAWPLIGGLVAVIMLTIAAGIWWLASQAAPTPKLETPQVVQSRPTAPIPEPQPAPVDDSPPVVVEPDVSDPASVVPAAPTPPTTLSLDELREIANAGLAAEIEKRIAEAKDLVARSGYGHVIVGKLELEEGSPRDVVSQMEILDDGYFVDAVATRDAPIGFWCPGFETTYLHPKAEGLVTWAGTVSMSKRKLAANSIKGRILINGQIPGQCQIRAGFKGWPLNVLADDDSLRQRQSKLAGEVGKLFPPNIRYDATTGEFLIEGMPAGASGISFEAILQNPKNPQESFPGGYTYDVDLGSSDQLDMRTLSIASPIRAQPVEYPEGAPPRAPDGTDKMRALLKQHGAVELPQFGRFADKVAADLKRLEEYRAADPANRAATLLVGRIKADGVPDDQLPNILAQQPIWPGGLFSILARESYPVGFRLHGYDPLDYVPVGSEGAAEFVPNLRMKRTAVRKRAVVRGRLSFAEGVVASKVKVLLIASIDNVGSHDLSGRHVYRTGAPIEARLNNKGEWLLDEMSPIYYGLNVHAPGYMREERIVSLEPGEKHTLLEIPMRRQQHVKGATITSAEDGFRTQAVQARPRLRMSEAVLVPTLPSEEGVVFVDLGPYMGLGYNRAMACLGAGNVDDFRNVDVSRLAVPGCYRLHLRPGMVYVLKGSRPNHKSMLFQVDAIRPDNE